MQKLFFQNKKKSVKKNNFKSLPMFYNFFFFLNKKKLNFVIYKKFKMLLIDIYHDIIFLKTALKQLLISLIFEVKLKVVF